MEEQNTLLDSLKKIYPDSSKQTLRNWVKQKRVFINGEPVLNASQKILGSEEIKVAAKPKFLKNSIQILYQDFDIVVIDKPGGLLSVATEKEKENTLHDFLKRHFYKNRVYPVHRLDKDTSGLIVFALNERSRDHLKSQFQMKSLSRGYMAIVHGTPDPKTGTWESCLYEDQNLKMRESTHGLGKIAITSYKTIYSTERLSLLDIRLHTGRKNQIRVQSASRNCPIIGDKKYGPSSDSFKRLGLHAYLLTLTHPTTNKKLCFKSMLPKELADNIGSKVSINEKTLSLQVG